MPHYCKREVWTLASRVKGAAQVLFFFYIYCVFLIFGPASISGPIFTSFHEEPTCYSITFISVQTSFVSFRLPNTDNDKS